MLCKMRNVVYNITNNGRSFFFLKPKITIVVTKATRHVSAKRVRIVTSNTVIIVSVYASPQLNSILIQN